MIDYEKLKEAYEKLNEVMNIIEGEYIIRHLEDLSLEIKRELEVLTKPEPKFKVGQRVYHLCGNTIESGVIADIYWDKDLQDYRVNLEIPYGKMSMVQSICYESREELIEAQVTHWLSMLDKPDQIRYFAHLANIRTPFITDCEFHNPGCDNEHDGMIYTSNPPQNKCKKCGEFYR